MTGGAPRPTSTVEVPPELRAAFEDALDRHCFVCSHPVRVHLPGSRCACCAKGVKLPSEVAAQLVDTVKAVDEAARSARRP